MSSISETTSTTIEGTLGEVAELLRVVKPAEAEARMERLITAQSGGLRTHEARLRTAISAFRFHSKKRMSRLNGLLEEALASITQAEQIEQAAKTLSEQGEKLRQWLSSSVLTIQDALDAATAFQSACLAVESQFKEARASFRAVAAPTDLAVRIRLVELLQAQGTATEAKLRGYDDSQLNLVLGVVRNIKELRSRCVEVCPETGAEAELVIDGVSRLAAERLATSAVSPELAWNAEVASLIQEHALQVRTLSNVAESTTLAVAVLLWPALSEKVRQWELSDGVLRLACDLSAYAEAKPCLEGVTRLEALSHDDIVLAGKYSGNRTVQNLIDRGGARDLEGLRSRLESREFNTFMVEGVQPRVAELAFSHNIERFAGIEGAAFVDENLRALRDNDILPADDFTVGVRRFDVKSNRHYRSNADRVGLRGFQVHVHNRSPRSELAGIVFTASSPTSLHWAFVGLCPESSIPVGRDRAGPYLFSLPSSLSFPDRSSTPTRLEMVALLRDCGSGAHETSTFRATDRASLLRSLDAISRGEDLTERALWDEATTELMELRSSGGDATLGRKLLARKKEEAESAFWLFRMASIGGRPLLSRWVDEVLSKLNEHWDRISCPGCRQLGRLSLRPLRITDAGTVTGAISCKCGFNKAGGTFITHCWQPAVVCGRYPLVIGAQALCDCGGLRCECGVCRCDRH